jgi:hypothetical protein
MDRRSSSRREDAGEALTLPFKVTLERFSFFSAPRFGMVDIGSGRCTTYTSWWSAGSLFSLLDQRAILDAYYLKRDSGLAVSAIRKREARESRTKTLN